MALIITGFILFGKQFINIWAGKGYDDAYIIACILMIPITIPLIQNIGLSILQAKNLHKFRTIIFLFIAIINVMISIPMSKKYGGIGAAIGTAFSLLVGQGIILNIYYHKKVGINIIEFWKNILQMLIPVIFTIMLGIFINRLFNSTTMIMLLIKICIYSIIYCILMWMFAMNEYERNILRKPLMKLKRG